MTHEQIEAAIERLKKMSYGTRTYTALEAVMAVVADGSWADGLIDLLRQADPDTHMELPMDADGVPIRVGDKVADWDTPRLVVAVSEDSICLAGYESDSYYRMRVAKNHRHHHKPTVEGVLREFVSEFNRDDTELCDEEIIERFAAKLRLADDGEEQ